MLDVKTVTENVHLEYPKSSLYYDTNGVLRISFISLEIVLRDQHNDSGQAHTNELVRLTACFGTGLRKEKTGVYDLLTIFVN